jgi:hypothetical protein
VDQPPAAVSDGLSRLGITRFLHGEQRVLRQKTTQRHQQIFHTGADNHLLRPASDAPGLPQIPAQDLAKL